MAVNFKNLGLAYFTEASYGVAPTMASTPTSGQTKLQFTRLVSEDFNTAFSREESNEVRGDAQTSGSVITSASGAGSISIQYSLDTYDELLPGLMFSEHVAQGDIQARDKGWLSFSHTSGNLCTAVTPSLAGNILTIGDDLTTDVSVGDYIYISESGSNNLDGVFKVAAIDTTTITLTNDTGEADVATYVGTTAVDAGIEIRVMQDICENGTGEMTYGFVRAYSDASLAGQGSATTGLASCQWAIFRGAYVTGLQLSVAPGQAGWTGTFSTLFKDETTVTDATSAATGSGLQVQNWDQTAEPNTNALPDAITGVAQIKISGGGVTKRFDALSMNVNMSNNSEEVSALRNRGALCINQGSFSASIEMELIYGDEGNALHAAMLNNDAFEIEFAIQDGEGRAQLWRFPKCRVTSERPNPGRNAPIVQSLSFQVEAGGTDYAGSTGAKMVECIRFYAPAAL